MKLTVMYHLRYCDLSLNIQGGARKYGGGVKILITRPILENNSAFESFHRVTCHVIMRFPLFFFFKNIKKS